MVLVDSTCDISSVLNQIETGALSKEKVDSYCFRHLSEKNKSLLKERGYSLYSGKVRDCVIKDKSFFMIHSDRLSAFDRHITDVPLKGLLLSKINQFWLEKASKDFPVAEFSSFHSRLIKMNQLKVFPIEVIVRGYLAGSLQRSYDKGERKISQHQLKDGLRSWDSLGEPIVTPTSKAELGAHDENMSPDEIIKKNICTKDQWKKIEELALNLYSFGREVYKKLGWILVDTKYEFAHDNKGNIFLIDEVHTPDSSRLWLESSYEDRLNKGETPVMLDKEIIRRSLLAQGFSGEGNVPEVSLSERVGLSRVYLSVAEKLYGKPLTLGSFSEESLMKVLV